MQSIRRVIIDHLMPKSLLPFILLLDSMLRSFTSRLAYGSFSTKPPISCSRLVRAYPLIDLHLKRSATNPPQAHPCVSFTTACNCAP